MQNRPLSLLFASCLFFQVIRGFSQPYVQDPTFEPIVLRTGMGPVDEFAVQADGKVIVFGDFNYVDGLSARSIARLHPGGKIDTTFKISWLKVEYCRSMAIQQDGRILLAGRFSLPVDSKKRALIRLNTDGSLDATFKAGEDVNASTITKVVMQSADKIVIAGTFAFSNGAPILNIARLNLDGSLDPAFISLTSLSGPMSPLSIDHVVIQPDGRIIIAGGFTNVNGTARKRFARLHQDGKLDESFVPGTRTELFPLDIALSGRKLVAVGYLSTWIHGTLKCAMERFNEDGSLDESFQRAPLDKYDQIEAVAVQPDGKMVIGGFYEVLATPAFERGKLLRINPDGTIDNSFPFSAEQVFKTDKIAYSNGKLLVAATVIQANRIQKEERFFQLDLNGSVDNTFRLNAERDGSAFAILPIINNALLVASDHKTVNGKPAPLLFRALPDGRVDSGFVATSVLRPVVALPDGSSLAIQGGTQLQKRTPAGSQDAAFRVGAANARISQVAQQKDGKIVVGGYFDSYNGAVSGSLVRLNADGSVDNTFDAKTFTKDIERFVIQPDGNIVATTIERASQLTVSIVQFNPNGSLVRSLVAMTGNDADILAIAVQPDGKVLLGGYFEKIGDYPAANLARLNADLTVDKTYRGGTDLSTNLIIRNLVVQPEGKTLISGPFTAINNLPFGGLARLHADGSLDTTFKFASPLDASASVIALQADGKLVIGTPGRIARYTMPLAQTIAFAAIADKLTSDSPFKLMATASSGLVVSFTLLSGPATLVGDSIKLTGAAGVVTIKATQQGNTFYKAAEEVEKSFTVQAVLAVEPGLNPLVKVYPNPSTSGFTLELPHVHRLQDLQLVSAQGKVITPSRRISGTRVQVATDSIPKGIYVLRALYDGKELKRRIVVR